MLTPKHYKDALAVQDACNLSGVVYAWAEVMKRVCEEAYAAGKGTDWKNSHPINVMYASKVASLTGCETPEGFMGAYGFCTKRAGD